MADYNNIQLVEGEGKVEVILNRPPVNILNIEMMKELIDAFRSFKTNSKLRVVLIRAEGKLFSAGVDVEEHTSDKVEQMIIAFSNMFKYLWEIDAVTIAAVNGAALGGGCELAIGCDLVVASDKAKFGQPEIKVGVFPPMATVVFPKLIGRNLAFEWLLGGDVYSSEEANRIGLINRVFRVDEFDAKVDEYVSRFTSQSASVIAISKEAIDRAMDRPARDGMSVVDMLYLRKLMHTHDAKEGLAAFLEKRDPDWKHY
ncbi:enoyl-CoA hydratase/isomerase family protein [bacterium]|nr:enoyl-CoA hydratase/isomerase family protein [bacterium]